MPTTEYRLTIRKVGPMPLEMLGHYARTRPIVLGQWADPAHAFLAMDLYERENRPLFTADGARARLVVTQVSR